MLDRFNLNYGRYLPAVLPHPSTGRVALLGIAHREISASCGHIPAIRRLGKPVPKVLKTLGDHILAKRFEQGLSRRQLAQTIGVTSRLVWQWELDLKFPSQAHLQALADALDSDAGFIAIKSHA